LTSVMVVPHRPAVLTAKLLSTIDVLSGGRVLVGVGAGWLEEEFEAIGAPPFPERGKVTDEYLQAFRELWTKSQPQFEGRFVKFSNWGFGAEAGEDAAPAAVGRRRERSGTAARGKARRRLVPDRHQSHPSAQYARALSRRSRPIAQAGRGGRPRSHEG